MERLDFEKLVGTIAGLSPKLTGVSSCLTELRAMGTQIHW